MTPFQLYPENFFRTFVDGCRTGGLVSGKGRGIRRLSRSELLHEFNRHKSGARKIDESIRQERLTALV